MKDQPSLPFEAPEPTAPVVNMNTGNELGSPQEAAVQAEIDASQSRHPAAIRVDRPVVIANDPELNADWHRMQDEKDAARTAIAPKAGRLSVSQQNANERAAIERHLKVVPKQVIDPYL